jgi:hypothetical protein
MKAYVSGVYVQLTSGSYTTVKLYRDGVARCQTCNVTNCSHTRAVHDYFAEAYAEDLLHVRQKVAA